MKWIPNELFLSQCTRIQFDQLVQDTHPNPLVPSFTNTPCSKKNLFIEFASIQENKLANLHSNPSSPNELEYGWLPPYFCTSQYNSHVERCMVPSSHAPPQHHFRTASYLTHNTCRCQSDNTPSVPSVQDNNKIVIKSP